VQTTTTNSSTNILNTVWDNSSLTAVWHKASPESHILFIVALAFAVHLIVKLSRHTGEWFIHKSQAKKNPLAFVTQTPKFITVVRLVVSTLTFVVYFLTFGFVMNEEFHLDLSTFLASATVIGLAISFGCQGLVQDVVIGVTLIFSNAMDVGEIVDLSGTIGRVEEIGLRFTKLINFYDQEIFVPNRNIANVSRFPHGGVYAYADIQLPPTADQARVRQQVGGIASGLWSQFHDIILSAPEAGRLEKAEGGNWNYLRVRFHLWPGQGSLIETTFRQQVTAAMKTFDPNYADWMVNITYRATLTSEDPATPARPPEPLAPGAPAPSRIASNP
jgi:moderate conductance mechanosensitive channel